jgi:non-heme chloroperoxidase
VQQIAIKSTDGVTLAAQVGGNPDGAEILFIHGFNQSQHCWARQLDDPALADHFRLVTFDLRGHGGSEKPADKAFYAADQIWADDVAAMIAATGLRRPVIVAWSYGGRVLADYVGAHGLARIAGINLVGAVTRSDRAYMGPGGSHMRGMLSSDAETAAAATRRFLLACFTRPPTPADFDTMLAYNMLPSPLIRALVLARTPNTADTLAGLTCPVLVSHGTEDQLILPSMAEFTASAAPRATLSRYDGIGHAPFWEDAPRFNRELAAFIRAIA